METNNTQVTEPLKLKDMKVKDNPFDLIFHTALELARNTLFLPSRLDNPDLASVSMDEAYSDWRLERIDSAVELLRSLSPEELALCRKTAYIAQSKNHNRLNDVLCDMGRSIPSVYAMDNPRYNVEYEKAVFGEDSAEYKRRRALDNLMSSDFSNISSSRFHEVYDYLTYGAEGCMERFNWTQNRAEEVGRLQYDYDLTKKDISYIVTNKGRDVE